jgi:hypothetical protein
VKAAIRLGVAGLAMLAACGCSDYFTPWTGFQTHTYSGTQIGFPMDAAPFSVGDSIRETVSGAGANWYSFSASADTVYALGFFPTFDGTLSIIDSSSGAIVFSFPDSTNGAYGTAFWTCGRFGTFYLHVRDTSDFGEREAPFGLSLKTFAGAYGSVIDSFEPDSSKSLANECQVTPVGNQESFQFRRLSPGDTDWVYFLPAPGHTYRLSAVGTLRVRLALLAPGTDSTAMVDDSAASTASLRWTNPASLGLKCYFRITGKSPTASGVYAVSVRDVIH